MWYQSNQLEKDEDSGTLLGKPLAKAEVKIDEEEEEEGRRRRRT